MQGCTALRKPQLPPPRGKSVGNPISSLKSLQKGSERWFILSPGHVRSGYTALMSHSYTLDHIGPLAPALTRSADGFIMLRHCAFIQVPACLLIEGI